MFAVHSTPSAGPKQGYLSSHLPHTRFSIHMFQGKPGFTTMDPAAYRTMPPAPSAPPHQLYHQPRYDERYGAPTMSHNLGHHGHGPSSVPVPIPGRHPSPPHLNINTTVTRGYEPAPPRPLTTQVPQQPSAPHSRGATAPASHLPVASHPSQASHTSHGAPGNFSIYPSANGQNTFVYEQSQSSKSDIFAFSDLDSALTETDTTSVATYSPTDSTATVGGDTPTTASPWDEVPTMHVGAGSGVGPQSIGGMERSASRGLVQHQADYSPWINPPPPPTGLDPRTLGTASSLVRSPSESDIDARERIAIVNARHNSVSTGSYYTPSPPLSMDQATKSTSQYIPMPPVPVPIPMPSQQPQHIMFSDGQLYGSPESIGMYESKRTSPKQNSSVAAVYTDSNGYLQDSSYSRTSSVPMERRASVMGGRSASNSPPGPIPVRERKASTSYGAGPALSSTPSSHSSSDRDRSRRHYSSNEHSPSRSGRDRDQPSQVQSTIPFSSSPPPSSRDQDRYGRRDDRDRDRDREREREHERDRDARGRYPSPEKVRSRTSSMSNGTGRPIDYIQIPPISSSDSQVPSSMGRGPRHPDLVAPPASSVAFPPNSGASAAATKPVESTSQSTGGRTRRLSFASQASEAATVATVATTGTEPRSSGPSSSRYTRDRDTSPSSSSGGSRSSNNNVTSTAALGAGALRLPEPQRRQSDADRYMYEPSRSSERERGRDSRDKERERDSRGSDSDRPDTRSSASGYPAHRHPETQRRYSDGDQNMPLRISTSGAVNGAGIGSGALFGRQFVPSRSVRWNENLICPSPALQAQRRKGWYNRRGDQLWTNDGVFKAAPPDQQYPPDLEDYPEPGEGWMNEEGVIIDIEHRRVPKLPRRSALKQTFKN